MKKEEKLIFDGLEFATKAHRGQFRKATKIPYIVHPLGVAEILIRNRYSNNLVVAGLLHDTVEDTKVTIKQIEKKFGKKIAKLVYAVSEENKNDSWEDRKTRTIEKLKKASREVLYLACADKLNNIRSIKKDTERLGNKVWKRFNRGKKKQEWYYRSLAKVFSSRGKNKLFKEFSKEVREVFG